MPVCCFDANRNSTVELSRVEVPPNMTSWPHFHNGVAAGLRIANFSQVSNAMGESSWRVHRVLWVWEDIFLSNTRPPPNDKELYPVDQTPGSGSQTTQNYRPLIHWETSPWHQGASSDYDPQKHAYWPVSFFALTTPIVLLAACHCVQRQWKVHWVQWVWGDSLYLRGWWG